MVVLLLLLLNGMSCHGSRALPWVLLVRVPGDGLHP